MTPEGHPGAHGAVSAPVEARRPDLEQLNELEATLKEERVHLRRLRETWSRTSPLEGTEVRPDAMPRTSIGALSKTTGGGGVGG